ncbi:MAG: response regulator [Terracidiphilus sp.]|nr:response regulator [Terracidiphilus sp.]
MPSGRGAYFLLASSDAGTVETAEPVLQSMGGRVHVVQNAAEAEQCLIAEQQPALAVLDAELPGIDAGWLVARQVCEETKALAPVVLISDSVSAGQEEMVAAGIVADLILRPSPAAYWKLRLDRTLQAQAAAREIDALRKAAGDPVQIDPAASIHGHEAILSLLFRETDRVQRLNSQLSIVLFGLRSNEALAGEQDALLAKEIDRAVAERTARVLRSYDALGCMSGGDFLLVLPGCSMVDARTMAERLQSNIFSSPFKIAGSPVFLSACFGVATSLGRSPVVVLREAEQALEWARTSGGSAIEFFSERQLRSAVGYSQPGQNGEPPLW